MKNEIWQLLDCKSHIATISLSLAANYILYMKKKSASYHSSHPTTRTNLPYVPNASLNLQSLATGSYWMEREVLTEDGSTCNIMEFRHFNKDHTATELVWVGE